MQLQFIMLPLIMLMHQKTFRQTDLDDFFGEGYDSTTMDATVTADATNKTYTVESASYNGQVYYAGGYFS